MTGAELGAQSAFGEALVLGDRAIRRDGVTKRELFSAIAMQGLLANPFYAEQLEQDRVTGSIGTAAVWNADQLLAELAKEPQP